MKNEVCFIGHCDYEYCDLGSFEYTCHHCNNFSIDYEIWWKQDEIYRGNDYKFKCEECDKELIVKWDKDEYIYYIE